MTPIEAVQGHLKDLTESLAQCAEAVQAQSEAQESVVVKVEQLQELFRSLTEKTGELFDEVRELNRRVGDYIKDQSKQSGIRDVDKRLRLVEEKLGG